MGGDAPGASAGRPASSWSCASARPAATSRSAGSPAPSRRRPDPMPRRGSSAPRSARLVRRLLTARRRGARPAETLAAGARPDLRPEPGGCLRRARPVPTDRLAARLDGEPGGPAGPARAESRARWFGLPRRRLAGSRRTGHSVPGRPGRLAPRASQLPGLTRPDLVGQHHGLDAVAQPQLGQHVTDVGLDRGLADRQRPGDLRVGVPARDVHQDLALALGEGGQRVRGGGRRIGQRIREPGRAAAPAPAARSPHRRRRRCGSPRSDRRAARPCAGNRPRRRRSPRSPARRRRGRPGSAPAPAAGRRASPGWPPAPSIRGSAMSIDHDVRKQPPGQIDRLDPVAGLTGDGQPGGAGARPSATRSAASARRRPAARAPAGRAGGRLSSPLPPPCTDCNRAHVTLGDRCLPPETRRRAAAKCGGESGRQPGRQRRRCPAR